LPFQAATIRPNAYSLIAIFVDRYNPVAIHYRESRPS